MAFSISITRFPQFLQVAATGEADLKSYVDTLQTAEQESRFWSDTRVLLDLQGVVGRPTTDEQVFLGELVAQSFSHLVQFASVVPPEQITRNSERAARSLGMKLRVFVSRDEAVAWLSGASDPAEPPHTANAA